MFSPWNWMISQKSVFQGHLLAGPKPQELHCSQEHFQGTYSGLAPFYFFLFCPHIIKYHCTFYLPGHLSEDVLEPLKAKLLSLTRYAILAHLISEEKKIWQLTALSLKRLQNSHCFFKKCIRIALHHIIVMNDDVGHLVEVATTLLLDS